MSKDLKKIDLSALKTTVSKFVKVESKHAAFGAVLIVLLVYLFVVFRINQFAMAEPSADTAAQNPAKTVKIDEKAIQQIQSLEKSNSQVQSLINEARNNPFQE